MYSQVWTTLIIGRVEERQKLILVLWSYHVAVKTTTLHLVSLFQSPNKLLSIPRLLQESMEWWWWMLPPKIIRKTNSYLTWKPYLQANQPQLDNINLQTIPSIIWVKQLICRRRSKHLMIPLCSSDRPAKAWIITFQAKPTTLLSLVVSRVKGISIQKLNVDVIPQQRQKKPIIKDIT